MSYYKDIINERRYIPTGRAGMSVGDRAAQFSAFAALTGFDGVIRESGRLTDSRAELDESAKAVINEALRELMEMISEQPRATLVWFRPDEKKTGGAYVPYTGNLKKVDAYHRLLVFTDGTQIPIDSLHYLQKCDR